jgi:hypothetical protein
MSFMEKKDRVLTTDISIYDKETLGTFWDFLSRITNILLLLIRLKLEPLHPLERVGGG